MRIEQIRIADGGPLGGVYTFPSAGLALWTTSNDVPEGELAEALAVALYGPRESGPRHVVLDARLDDGRSLRIERDVDTGVLEIDGEARDAVRDRGPGAEPGRELFGLSREEFLVMARIPCDEVRATPRHVALRRLLGGRRADSVAEPPVPLPTIEGIGVVDPPDPGALTILRSPAEELFGRSGNAPGTLDLDLELSRTDAAPAPVETPVAEGGPVAVIRELRRRLSEVQQQLVARSAELQTLSERLAELRSERGRLGIVAEEAPADPERLEELSVALREGLRRRRDIERERTAFDAELAQAGLDEAALRELDRRFTGLDAEDRELLAGYDQECTVRRGNAALARSECRLEESKLHEIETLRAKGVRGALLPLGGAAFLLFAGIGAALLRANGAVVAALIGLGLAGCGAAGWLFWRARLRGEDERLRSSTTLSAKREQLAGIEARQQEGERRLGEVAGRVGAETTRALREQWNRWNGTAPQRETSDAIARRSAESGEELASLQAKLGAFLVGTGLGELPDLDRLQATIEDYQRFFRAGRELADAETRARGIDASLAKLEAEQAAHRSRIDGMLVEVGIDPQRDLDEAIEMFALRAGYHESPAETVTDSLATTAAAAARALEEETWDTSWTPRVSAATEAMLRRFLPEAREVEVDEHLVPTLRLASAAPRIGLDEVARELSSVLHEQVCLALRLAIVETLNSTGERVPLFLDDPWARADDRRHAAGLTLLVEDLGSRRQIVLRTSQEVRVKWFLHQSPSYRSRITAVAPSSAPAPSAAAPSAAASQASLSAHSLQR